jgi:hypothetical protein
MYKKFIVLVVLALCLRAPRMGLQAQNLEVFAAGGLALGNESFTIGETFVGFFMQSPTMLTEGFHQPDLLHGTDIAGATADEIFALSPNPASEATFLHALRPLMQDYDVTLHDLHGRLLWQSKIHLGENDLQIPLSTLSQSMYFLRIHAERPITLKIEKIGT